MKHIKFTAMLMTLWPISVYKHYDLYFSLWSILSQLQWTTCYFHRLADNR